MNIVIMVKAKALPDGTVRTHGGIKKRKMGGKWVSVGDTGKDVGEELMTPEMLSQLQELYGTREKLGKIGLTIDPDSPTYAKLGAFLDTASLPRLKQLADANIRFLSGLARKRVLIHEMKRRK